nr:reverse transcriptase domain-containing protein [Tanacetum cinerariifolium]
NTIANPRGDLKEIITQSGVSYDRQPIPPSFYSLHKVVERVPEETKDTVQPSTKNIQPPVVQNQVPIDEPVVTPKPKLTIPYPSRVTKQKLREKDDNLALKFVEIFRKLHFDLSFVDAFLHMPKFALMFKSLLNNKEKLFDLATTPVNENYSEVVLNKRPVLRIGQALIDFYGEELTLRVDDEAITSKSGNPTLIFDPIIGLSSPSLTPFEGGNFILEEIEACLTSKSIPPRIDDTDFDLEGDIHLLEKLLNDDPSSSPLYPKELNVEEIKTVKSSIDEPPELELKELPSYLEYTFLEGTDKLRVIISKELKDEEKSTLLKVLKSHKQAIAWKISNIKELLAVVYASEKFRPYLVLSKTIVYTDYSDLKYLLAKQDAKPRLLWWILLLNEFDAIIRDKKEAENLAADHLIRLENPHQDELEKKEITKIFPVTPPN